MPENRRFPRKIKKQLKKDSETWEKYLEEKRIAKEKNESLDLIFSRNYSRSAQTFRNMFRYR